MTNQSKIAASPIQWQSKAGYSVASIGLSAIELMLQVYLLELYLLAGLEPSLAGTAIALAVVWDAISDPVMGVLSDKTPSKSLAGKRVPYLLAGSALIGIAFHFLFNPPVTSDQSALFNNLLVWYLVVNTASTLFSVPHLSVVNDLSGTKQERASFFGWRMALGSIGLLLGIGLPAYFAFQFPSNSIADTLQIRGATGFALGTITTIGCLLCSCAVWRTLKIKSASAPPNSSSAYRTIDVLKQGIRSPLFCYLSFGFIAIAVGRSFNSSLALPYYKSTLMFSEEAIGTILLVLTVFIILAAPIWVHLSRYLRKSQLFVTAVILLALLSAIAYPLLRPNTLWPVLLLAGIGGILVASIVLLDSLFSDFIEEEKENQEKDVSGVYYGIWRMFSKIARALGIACSGFFLSLMGYEQGSLQQAASVERSIAWAFGPGVAAFLLLGGWAIFKTLNYHRPETVNQSTAIPQ